MVLVGGRRSAAAHQLANIAAITIRLNQVDSMSPTHSSRSRLRGERQPSATPVYQWHFRVSPCCRPMAAVSRPSGADTRRSVGPLSERNSRDLRSWAASRRHCRCRM